MKINLSLLVLIAFITALSACTNPTATVTTTIVLAPDGSTVTEPPVSPPTSPSPTLTATYTLPTTPTTTVEPFVLPDNGSIKLPGFGEYYKFQRVYDYIKEPTYFEGVIFAPHKEAPGTTTTGPILYKIDVQFADGTVEVLQYIGLGFIDGVDINLTKHKNPGAGVLLAWQDISGGLRQVLYLLVGEQ